MKADTKKQQNEKKPNLNQRSQTMTKKLHKPILLCFSAHILFFFLIIPNRLECTFFNYSKDEKRTSDNLAKKSDNLHKMLVVLKVHIINQIMWTEKSVRFREIPSSDCGEIGVLGLFTCQMTIDWEFTTWTISLVLFAMNFDYIKGYIMREIVERPVSFNEIENKNTLIKTKSICNEIDGTHSVKSFHLMEAKVFDIFCIQRWKNDFMHLVLVLCRHSFLADITSRFSDDNQKAGAISITSIVEWRSNIGYIENMSKSSLSNAPSVFRQMHYYVVRLSSDWSDVKIIVIS